MDPGVLLALVVGLCAWAVEGVERENFPLDAFPS